MQQGARWFSKRVRLVVALLSGVALTVSATSSDSFRLANGDLIRTGMTQLELLVAAGEPLSKTIDPAANAHPPYQNSPLPAAPVRERWLYQLEGSIGGRYWLEVQLTGHVVDKLDVVQP